MSLLNLENNCQSAVWRIRNRFNSLVFMKMKKTFTREITYFFQILHWKKFLFSVEWDDIPVILESKALFNMRGKLSDTLKQDQVSAEMTLDLRTFCKFSTKTANGCLHANTEKHAKINWEKKKITVGLHGTGHKDIISMRKAREKFNNLHFLNGFYSLMSHLYLTVSWSL